MKYVNDILVVVGLITKNDVKSYVADVLIVSQG